MSPSCWGSEPAKPIWASLAQRVFTIVQMGEPAQGESLRKGVLCLDPRNSNTERLKKVASRGDLERVRKEVGGSEMSGVHGAHVLRSSGQLRHNA